jgi:hypothetical protein
MCRLPSVCAAVLAAAACTLIVAADPPRPREGDLKVGDKAPDFEAKDVKGKTTVKLSELKDKPIVLIFGSCT